jgi:hypothetical protein
LPAKQHAPKARPSPATASRRRAAGQAVKREWHFRFDLRSGGSRTSRRPRVAFFDRNYLAGERGVALARLGQPEAAQEVLRTTLVSLDPSVMKTRPRLLTALATAHVQQGDVDRACELGVEALGIAAQQEVQPNLQDVRKVRLELEPWRNSQAVKDFDEQLRAVGAA